MNKTNAVGQSSADTLNALLALGITAETCDATGPQGDHWPRRFKSEDRTGSAVVCFPDTASDVAKVFALARERGLRVAAFGLGSSVVGCFDGAPEIFVSTARMNAVIEFDPIDCRVTVGAGMNGGDLQQYLLKCGFELGQSPQSLYMSTVGGWVNTRATGGLSTYFGGIEDVVVGLQAVLPNGDIIDIAPRPRPSGGFDPIRALIGTEGSLAIVTSVTLAVFRQLPSVQMAAGFDTFAEAIEAQRQLVQGGFPVALLRSYNHAETHHVAPGPKPYSLLNFTLVAPSAALGALKDAADQIVRQCGGTPLNEDVAHRWYIGRYKVETMMEDRNAEPGKMFDTIEISLPWRQASACVDEIEAKVGPRTKALYAHFSHAYQTGACLYVIFWTDDADNKTTLVNWSSIWNDVTDIVVAHGGTLSHHHGIGAIRAERYQNSAEGRMHAAIKTALDPDNALFARLLEKN